MGSKFGYVVVFLVVALFGYGIYRVWDDYRADRARDSSSTTPVGDTTGAPTTSPPAEPPTEPRTEPRTEKTPVAPPQASEPIVENAKPSASSAPVVELDTTLGTIVVQLDAEKAPKTVANFLGYVDRGHYDGTQFHRVAPGFCIQGGHFTDEGTERESLDAPVVNESSNGLSNLRGTLAMARTADPDSAQDQFYINLADNTSLDYPKHAGTGYAVFGKVIEGMKVVDAIGQVPVANLGGVFTSRPKALVMIRSAKRR